MTKIMLENYCEECDDVIHTLCDDVDFHSFKVGRVVCPTCGTINHPCNECEPRTCYDCPYYDVKALDSLTDEEYIKWVKEHNPNRFENMLSGSLGDFYQKLAKNLLTNV